MAITRTMGERAKGITAIVENTDVAVIAKGFDIVFCRYFCIIKEARKIYRNKEKDHEAGYDSNS